MLFRKKISRSCEHCRHGTVIDETRIQCKKRGIVSFDAKCWRFQYDPCKRIPPKRKALNFDKYDEEDYSL